MRPQPSLLRRFRSHSKTLAALVLVAMAGLPGPVSAADFYWDPDGDDNVNNLDGTDLGGNGTWDLSTANWWDTTSLVAWPNLNTSNAIFSYPFPTIPYAIPTPFTVTVDGGGVTANRLTFQRSGYTISGGAITLAGTGAGLHANLGESATISSKISGGAGLTLTGGGWVRLGDNANNYTGTTTLNNGALVITGEGALGADSSPIVVTRVNSATTSTGTRGFGGGSLVLDGTGGNVTLTRDLTLHGHGPWSDRGAAVVSTGTNTLSGTVQMGGLTNGANVSTRIIAADGTLNLTGTLDVQGTAATTISQLGGVNQAGASFYNVTGALTGTGTLEGSGGGTLFLNPSDTSGFSGTIRVSGSAASGQSVVRIDSAGVLGTRTAGTTSAVLDLNGGVLAVLMDTPDVKVSNGSNANVYGRASSTIFADHTPGSSVKDQTVAFGNLSYEDNITLTFNSRNGYGMSFTTAPVNGGNADSTMTNNLQGGALLTFAGNFWSNADNGGNRIMIINGNGNTLINGNIIASAAAFNHSLTKGGTGTLTLTGTGSTLDGNVNVSGGTLAINDWRAITNNTSEINIGATTTSATLSIIGNNVSQANLTTSKVIDLAGTTGGATILANQTGTSPGVILNADFNASGGTASNAKTLTLGGTNIGANTINGAIPNNAAGGLVNLTKVDAGRWVLAGQNTYTGATTITNGILQIQANAASSTILADTSGITFGAVNNFAGGTLEFVGQPSANNVETLGAITYTGGGAATVKLTPGSGGTASLIFPNISTGGTATINFVGGDFTNNTITLSQINAAVGSDGIITRSIYWNGADFAYRQGGVLRAPNYGVDAGTVTSSTALAAGHNEITGSFATNSISISTLKINGGHTLTLNGGQTLTLSGFGLLATGGSATITGGNSLTVGGNNTLVVRVDGGADSLRIETPLTGFTGGLTKSGAGMLVLAGANTQTGTFHIAEGTVRLAGSGTLGGAAALTIRQDGILELNGITPTNNVNAFINNGIVRNTSATTDVTLTVGGGNGTGDSRGIIEDGGAGKISVVKIGTGAQNWLGLSTYTGTTTIGSTGIVSINNLQNGGMASGIGASSNAAGNLIFNGTSTTQAYGGLSYTGTTNDETDRLFTFNGGANGGVRIQSNGVNHATSTWTNPGALVFGPNAAGNPQGLVLGGSSTGDNRFFPIISDNGAAATSVYKADAGVWYLMATNGYTGATTLRGGALYANDGTSLPTASNLVFDGGNFATTGNFNRTIGTGSSQLQWTAHGAGGFSAGGSPLVVNWGSGNVWGSTAGFLGTGALLLNNSGVAKSDVTIASGFEITQGAASAFNATTTAGSATVDLTSGTTVGLAIGQEITGNPNIPAGRTIATIVSATQFTLNSGTGVLAATGSATNTLAGGYRQINVGDFTSIGADFATISGVITGAGSLAKEGVGILNLRGNNTYTGQTLVRAGTLVVETLGLRTSPGATSVGDSTLGNTNAGAILLGNGGTGGILEYVGLGEVSDRKIRLNSTDNSSPASEIHADGVGSLILTNVVNDSVSAAKLLNLRGVSSAANFITSQLSDNGGALSLTIDGSTAWVLTNGLNDYTGTTTVGAGALGIGHNSALGTGALTLSSGSVFAYGGDRTLANPVNQANNTVTAFIGDYSLTFGSVTSQAGANNWGTTNNLAAGKTLSFGAWTANSLTADRTWTIDGSGLTIINGDITSSTAFGVNLTKTGNGILQLNGTGSNYNQSDTTTDIDRGTLRLGASNVIPDGSGFGGVTLSPELAGNDTATLDLNGFSETINGLTMNSDGIAIIDNTSATAASLTFGANNAAVSIGGGIGTYTIQNSGGGALSITKTGGTAALVPTGVALNHTGTTNVNGGSLTIASALNGTTGLSVTNATTLSLTGGLTLPGSVTSLVVDNGSTLSLLDGAGNKLNGLNSLQLGSASGTMTFLNLNVGDLTVAGDELSTDTLTLLTGGTLSLFANNQITFNLTDIGLNPSQTYELLNFVDGGFTGGPLANTDYLLGATPGGFSSITLTANNNSVFITTGNLITDTYYWRGALGGGTDTTWNGNADNWSEDKAGTVAAGSIPGSGIDVVFQWDAPSNAAVVTTLEQNFRINSLTFEDATVLANTATSVTIDPGTVATSRLEVGAGGINLGTTNATTAVISGPVRLGASQTWNVTNSASVLSIGSLQGEADVTKSGPGKVTLTAASDPTFNGGVTSDFTINAGTLELTNSAALGNTINANLANVVINGGGAFYYNNAAAGTVANPLTLAGGTLSAGGNTQIYSGAVNVSGNSFINMAENNGPGTNTARSITLSGAVSGSGGLTVSSNTTTLTGGNPEGGTFLISNAASSWSGPLTLTSGTVDIPAAASPTVVPSSVTFDAFGRLIVRGLNGQTYNQPGAMTFTAGTIGEYLLDNTSSVLAADFVVNQNGQVNIGSGGTGASARFTVNDGATILNINGGVVLGGNSSISVDGGDADSFTTISGVISDGGSGYSLAINDDAGGWAVTNDILRLTGANSFSGNVSLSDGVLEFNTVTNMSGGASSLGNGTAITMAGGTLRFMGGSSQSTDRPISITGTGTLSANGTSGATITYSGAINIVPITDGTKITLTGAPGSAGIISGGITQAGDEADMTVNGGTWTISTATSRVGDAMTVTGADTILNLTSGLFQVRDDFAVTAGATLNLNGTGVLSFNTPTLTSGTLQATANGVINLGANDAVVATEFDELRIGTDAAGVGTFNMSTFNQTVTGFILGNRNLDRSGVVNGTGTLTVTGNFDIYGGTVNANLASTGTEAMEKIGAATVTLAGNNSGLASTGDTIVYDGVLNLNYTVSNTSKINVTQPLDMRGARVNLIGNNGAASTQNVTGLTLGSGGSSTIQVTGGTGQEAVLNLGAITRGNLAQDGTIRFILPGGTQSATNGITTTSPNSTFGMLGTGASATSDAAYATVEDGTGSWFATASGGNVVALASIAKNDVTTWLAGEHITDETTGFTGTLQYANINSLRFNAAGGSDLVMPQGGVLLIGSGGFLITNSVGGTPSLMGGTLVSGATELVITQDSTQMFEIGSDIRINTGVTKTGTGTLRLTGDNVYTGVTEIQEGTLQVTGNSIGDTSVVTLSASRPTTLELLADETIGRLQGGSRNTDADYGTVAIGSNTLTINNSGGNTTYAGFFTGDGSIVRQGTHNLSLTNVSSGFTGVFTVESGAVLLSGIGQINANVIRINKGGALMIDNNGTTRSGTRILDTTTITLNSADGTFQGATVVRGLGIRSDQDGTLDETVGTINFNTGASYIGMGTGGTNDDSDIIAGDIVRLNNSTMNVRGTALGTTAARSNNFRVVTASEAALIATLVGDGGAAGTQNLSILPWGIGEAFSGDLADANMGNSLLTYVTGVGFRPLDFASEYDTLAGAAAIDNARESLGTDLTGLAGTTVNSLVINNAAFAGLDVTGAGSGQSLAITSGAMLFTVTGGVASTAYDTTLGGFDSGISVGATNEYVIHVVNPSSAATTSTLTATIASPLTSTADITKSGRGTLILNQLNTAGGGANKTTINEGILEIADLDHIGGNTGALVFAGGTLRFGAGLIEDISTRTITLLDGGGTLDTNGIDLALANSVGSGLGGLTKAGLGNLTLNAAATYTGSTTITAGTLTIGANNATGNGGALNLGAGATLAMGTSSITTSLLTTSGASPLITGTGTIAASTGFFFGHTGDTQIDAVLAGSGGLFKNQTNVLTLTGLNTYAGTTEIQNGTIVFNSIANVGGGASALGAPTTVEAGVIRVGLTTADPVLTYTGTGHSTDRIIEIQGIAGGNPVINGNGTGALALGRIQSAAIGARTLTLAGTSDIALVNSVSEIREVGAALAVTKSGTNTWLLGGANSYTGTTTIAAGELRVGNNAALGSGTVSFTGGTLHNHDGNRTLANAVSLGGTGTLAGTGDFLFTGDLSQTGGSRTLNVNNTGTTTFGDSALDNFILAENNQARTLTLNVAAASAVVVNATVQNGTGSGADGFTKGDAGSATLNAANTYTGVTTVANGTLVLGADQTMSGNLFLGTAATAGSLDLSTNSGQFAAMSVLTNSNSLTNTVTIGATESLTLTGNVTIGSDAAASTTLFSAIGGGSFVQNASGGTFQVGGGTGGTNVNAATADFSGLANFTSNLGSTGTFRVGDNNTNGSGTPVANSNLILASTSSSITAGTVNIGQGAGQGASVQTLSLGAGSNAINADTINIGGNTTRSGGAIVFGGATGSVTIRAADGTSRATVNMTNGAISTSFNQINDLTLAGHSADLLVGTLTLASRSAGSGFATSTLTFDQGTLDVTTLNMASRTGAGTGNATATVTLGDSAAPGSPTTTIGTLNMAVNTSGGGTVSADLDVTGGNVTIGTGSGTAINMGNAAASRTVTSTIDLTGGAVDVTGNIVRTGGAGTENATVTLNGSSLDMNGFSIGTGAATINFLAQSGTLENLAELNGGAGLSKTTAGTLILEGNNTYTGGTTISDGILQVGSGSTTGTLGAGTVTNNATLTFNRSNSYTVNDDISGTGKVIQAGSGTTVLGGNNSHQGGTDINAGVLQANHANALGTSGTIDFGGGTLQHSANNTVDYSARIENSASAVKIDTNGQTVTYAGDIDSSNTGGLEKTGAGTLVLTSANTYSGKTTVSGGTLSVSSETNLGADAGAPAADHLTLDGGTLQTTATFAIDDTNRGITLGAGGGTIETAAATTLTVANAITGAGNLIKDGDGTLTFTAANTYTGTTTVSDGILLVKNTTGVGTGTDVVTVASGATLGGDGTVGGDTFINGNLTTGADTTAGTVGTLNFGGNDLSFNNGSTWFVDLMQGLTPSSDSVTGVGNLNITATSKLAINFSGTFTQGNVFTIANYGGIWNNGVFSTADGSSFLNDDSIWDGASLGNGNGADFYRINYNDSGAITLTAVPEPGTLGLLGLALGGFFVRRLRKRRAEAVLVAEAGSEED